MKKENNEILVELYPEMFTFTVRDYKHNPFEKAYNKVLWELQKRIKFTRKFDYYGQVNPYKYQFEVGDGWFNIIKELIAGIKENDKKKGDWITKVTQIKEKFGGLRFYVTGTSDKNWKLIHKAEEKSYAVCEETGSEVEVGTWNNGWIRTICRNYALQMYYDMVDKGEAKKSFAEYWKPKEKAVVIETPKKKKR
jgi:hypothetical protein